MENLEPYPGFYDEKQYGEYEKQFLHYATVSMQNIFVYKTKLSKFYFLLFYRTKN